MFGAIDNTWIDDRGSHSIVDYKATSTKDPIVALDKPWHDSYKRQMEIYQWLVRQSGLVVSDVGYFVYCNGIADSAEFGNRLDFETILIAYEGSDSWVKTALIEAYECLNSDTVPPASPDCDYCLYTATQEIVVGEALAV